MKKRVKLILTGIIILLLLSLSLSGLQVDYSNPKDFDEFVEVKTEKALIAGLSVVYIKDNEVVYKKNHGYSDIENNQLITDDTIFQIASVSKTVTATAIMQLYEQGLIGLDDDVNEYLDFEIINPKQNTMITIRKLLSHTSGLIDDDPEIKKLYTFENGGDSLISLDTYLKGYLLKDGEWYDEKNDFADNNDYEYSNIGYGLLGLLVENITEIPFNEYCYTNIFEPLEMNNTGWLSNEIDQSKLAKPYQQGKNLLLNYSFPTYPDGSLKTTIDDYSIFLRCMMNNGVYNDIRILKSVTVQQMFNGLAHGLGWDNEVLDEFMIGTDEHKIIGHSWGDPGVFTITFFNQENNTGVIMFTNTDPPLNLRVINVISMFKRFIEDSGLYE